MGGLGFLNSVGRENRPTEFENFFGFWMLRAKKSVYSRVLGSNFNHEMHERHEKGGFKLYAPCCTKCFFRLLWHCATLCIGRRPWRPDSTQTRTRPAPVIAGLTRNLQAIACKPITPQEPCCAPLGSRQSNLGEKRRRSRRHCEELATKQSRKPR